MIRSKQGDEESHQEYCTIIEYILMNALRTMNNNPFKESFYGKRKNKTINILTVFPFLIKVVSKLS